METKFQHRQDCTSHGDKMPNVPFQKKCIFRHLGKLQLASISLEVRKSKAHGSTTKQFCIESTFQEKLKQ